MMHTINYHSPLEKSNTQIRGNIMTNECEARETACKIIMDLKKNHPCTCLVQECPFKGTCELCIKNHLESNTLPSCCLPNIEERQNINEFPTCRSPLLWMMISVDKFNELYNVLPDDTKEKIKQNIYNIMEELSK